MITKTINLLPKEQLRQLQFRSWYFGLKRFYLFSGISFGLVLLVCAGVWWYLATVQGGLELETELLKQQSAKRENADLRKQIKQVNNQIADYNTLATGLPAWSDLLREFARLVPPGVHIQQFSVDSSKKQVVVSGFAATRELVVELHDNIAADTEHFADIDYPLENVARPKDVSFHYSFMVKDKTLKQLK